ncbi:MAG: type IV toxin-antitoxin system AbiEi family antitoxin domain-containing protein [Oscillospiraceae bacterium]|nr:type IV toxin-antitoxin system AbiEi family antitoxin domain-containing protein [Oscillospiraceae bacterium]
MLSKIEIANDVFGKVGAIAKTSDFVAAGLSNSDVVSLCNQGYIERIRHGFFKLSGADEPSEEEMLSKLLPQGIICVESALFYYGYGDFTPRKWTVTVPRSSSRSVKAMGDFPLKAYYVQNEFHHYGETAGNFNGVMLHVYDRERTVCDCFKYRTKLDSEIFSKAINAYAADPQKNLPNLAKYADDMKVYKKMMSVMEVILNG